MLWVARSIPLNFNWRGWTRVLNRMVVNHKGWPGWLQPQWHEQGSNRRLPSRLYFRKSSPPSVHSWSHWYSQSGPCSGLTRGCHAAATSQPVVSRWKCTFVNRYAMFVLPFDELFTTLMLSINKPKLRTVNRAIEAGSIQMINFGSDTRIKRIWNFITKNRAQVTFALY